MKKEMKNTIILYSHELFGNLRVAIQPDSKGWEVGFVVMDIVRILGFNNEYHAKKSLLRRT